jgi:hypothetical protein
MPPPAGIAKIAEKQMVDNRKGILYVMQRI